MNVFYLIAMLAVLPKTALLLAFGIITIYIMNKGGK